MRKEKWNTGWRFWKDGNEKNAVVVQLPHDAMQTEERDPQLEGGASSGFYPGGKYYYQKTFVPEESCADQHVMLQFGGVYMDATVLLNEERVGGRLYGYSEFFADLTGKLKIGEENTVTVIADNSKTPNSRWYSGSGIYRDVHFLSSGAEYILPRGLKVKTLSIAPVKVQVSVAVQAAADTNIRTFICDGERVIAEGKGTSFETELPDAGLWDDEHPNLYTVRTVLEKDGRILDQDEVTTGFRMVTADAKCGLQINGRTVKLRGACVHHDHGPLGACAMYKAELRRVKKLKELGYNAIRYAHNPADDNILEICDRLGMYLLDATFDQWKVPQSAYDYAIYFDAEWKRDIESLVARDYNHPAVILYCIGNEISDTGLPHGATLAKMINETVHALDDTRLTTLAVNPMLSVLAAKIAEKKAAEAAKPASERNDAEEEKMAGSQEVNEILTMLPKIKASITAENFEPLIGPVFANADVAGYNYNENLYEDTHAMVPDRVILSSETFPSKIGSNWPLVDRLPYVIGDFMWTAWDYLGEAGVGLPFYGSSQAPFSKSYPCHTAGCGSVDLTGYVESQGYYTSIVYGVYRKPYIAVRPVDHAGEDYTVGLWRLTDAVNSWSWPGQDGKKTEVFVYSIGSEAELIQDGVSLGRKALEECRCSFAVTYTPGELIAVSYDGNGKEIAREKLASAKEAVKLTILPEETQIQADGEDLAYLNVQITDADGIPVLLRDRKVRIRVEGAGVLRAVADANPETSEKFSDAERTTYHGRMLAIVQSSGAEGNIRVTAEADGLQPASVDLPAAK